MDLFFVSFVKSKYKWAETDPGWKCIYLLRLFLFFSSSNLKRGQGNGVKERRNTQPTATKHPKEQQHFRKKSIGAEVCSNAARIQDRVKPYQGTIQHEQFLSMQMLTLKELNKCLDICSLHLDLFSIIICKTIVHDFGRYLKPAWKYWGFLTEINDGKCLVSQDS